jgi:GTP-binding protein Era
MAKSGFVAIAGRPNVGKSTILNGLLKEKIAIVSEKPETTRDNIRGILTIKGYQIVFIDTPGLHKPHDLLGRVMVTRAQSTIMEADMILFITERDRAFDRDDMSIVARLPGPAEKKKVVLIINKIDKVKDKKTLLPIMQKACEIYPFSDVLPMSALKEKDLETLLEIIKKHIKRGTYCYPKEQKTDKSETFQMQEMIREKVLSKTYEEVPHSIGVIIDEVKEKEQKDAVLEIYATIFVERLSQKSIIIGKKGEMIKRVGQEARADIEKLLSRHVYLNLWVKVKEKWKKSPEALKEMGYSD